MREERKRRYERGEKEKRKERGEMERRYTVKRNR